MDWLALKTDIAARFPTLTDPAAAAAAMNALTIPVQGPITMARALTWVAANGVLPTLRTLRTQTANTLYGIADAACTMFDAGYPQLDLSSPDVQTMIGALVQGGVLTAAQQANLMALGQRTRFYVQVTYNVTALTADDVTEAWAS